MRWRKDQKRVDRRKLKAVVDGREKAEAAAKLAAEKAQLKLAGLQTRMAHLVSTRADQAAKWLTQREEMKIVKLLVQRLVEILDSYDPDEGMFTVTSFSVSGQQRLCLLPFSILRRCNNETSCFLHPPVGLGGKIPISLACTHHAPSSANPADLPNHPGT